MTLQWSPSTDPNVTGYDIYYGVVSRTYTNKVDVGNVTNATITGLVAGVTYYFAATAYNILGVESDYSSEVSYTIPVAAGNQPPTLNPISNVTILENAGQQTVSLSGITSGATNEIQTLVVGATSGTTSLIPNPTITYTSPNTTGTLTFTPAANGNGTAVITVKVNDGGASNNIVTQTFTVTVLPVNQPPTLNPLNSVTVLENAAQQSVSLSGIGSGAANESQTLTVTATSGNAAVVPNPTITYSSANATGTLRFTPVPGAFGSALITVTVNDGQASNNVTSQTFTITVNPVNQQPTINALSALSISENAGSQTVSLSGITSGAANENQTLTVTATSDNTSVIPNPAVSYLSPSTSGTISFAPKANATGSANITVTVNDGGTSNNIVSTSFKVTVNSFNNPPTLSPIANVTILENAGAQTVNLAGITSGSSNEIQTLTVTAKSSNTSLIPNPTVNYTSANSTGTLAFSPSANGNGSATITVTVIDGGGGTSTTTQTFTVTVIPVNQQPTLNVLAGMSINEDSGVQTVSLSGITSGAANENQVLTVTAASDNTHVVPNPGVTYVSPSTTGSISFTPAASAYGTANITVTVNDGQPSNNIVSRTFAVTVNPVNHPPTINALANITVPENAGPQTVQFSGVTSGATNEIQPLTVTAASGNAGFIPQPSVSYTSPNTTGSLTFTPVPGVYGVTTVTVTVNDNQSANNLTSQSFTVTINASPTISQIPDLTIGESTNSGPVAFTIGDPDTSVGSLTVSANSSDTSLIANSGIAISGTGASRVLSLTPVTGQTGSATVTLNVSDGSSTTSESFLVTVLAQPPPPDNLTVVINGAGTVTPNLSSKTLIPGKIYAMTAVPAPGMVFAGWSGSYKWPSTKLSFYMYRNLRLQANFVPSPYQPAAGTYNGLFYDTNGIELPSSGYFSVKLTTKGSYSAKLNLGSGKYSFSGTVGLDGHAKAGIIRKLATPLILNLWIQTNGLPNQITGQVSDGSWTSSMLGDRVMFDSKTNLAPYAGNYTMVIPGEPGNPSMPGGYGYGTLKIDTKGNVRFGGVLADGTKITQATTVSQDGMWPMFASLYSGNGSVLSWMEFTNRTSDDLNGQMNWIRLPGAKSKYYTSGFTWEGEATGSAYLPPVGANILGLTSGQIGFTGGNLTTDFTNSITLGSANKLLSWNGAGKLALAFSLPAGSFKGTVPDPITGKSLSFSGVVLQKSGIGYGTLLGSDQSSLVILSPSSPLY